MQTNTAKSKNISIEHGGMNIFFIKKLIFSEKHIQKINYFKVKNNSFFFIN